jgi:Ca2+-binding RTX toxin-like protein
MFGSYLSFAFNTNATSERVSQVIRAVTYSTSGSSGTTDIKITALDSGSRASSATVTVLSDDVIPTGGKTGGEVVSGTRTSDRLVGTIGDDTLAGALGNDVLTGGAGKDIFKFNTKPGKWNVDKITDFRTVDDSIHLENSIFKALGKKTGTLKKAAFWIGAKAHDTSDRIVYDKKKGALYYDEDGSGFKAAVKFATINKVALTEKDFFIV